MALPTGAIEVTDEATTLADVLADAAAALDAAPGALDVLVSPLSQAETANAPPKVNATPTTARNR